VIPARTPPPPARDAEQLRALVPADGPPTVRVCVYTPSSSPDGLHATPPPRSDRKLSRPHLTALADAGHEVADSGASRFPEPGDVFLGFRLISELGRGAFARVFLAHQEALAGRPVALKVTLRPTREAERLARLQHTNVVPVYSVHEAPPAQVICMPFLGRRTIADLIRAYRVHHSSRGIGGRRTTRAVRPSRTTALADSRLAPKSHPRDPAIGPAPAAPKIDASESLIGDPMAVLRLLAKLADGLVHAHERGILHLDLKPANVLLADDGEPMLLDFNLSFDAADRDRGLVGGTLPYMAIEQLIDLKSRGKGKIDARTDLYSLGVMAYEMLTGTVPFPANGPSDIETLIADRRAAPSVRALNPLVSPAIEAIVKKLLAPAPKDRYQSAADLRTDLQRHLSDLPLSVVTEPSLRERFGKWRRRNPGVLARLTAAAVFGLTIGVAAAAYLRAETNARAAATERVRIVRSGLDSVRLDLILPGDPAARTRGIAKAEETLAAYGLPGDTNWTKREDVKRLSEQDRAALGGDLGELLLLVAQAKWREAEHRPNPARLDAASDALKFNRAARACFAPDAIPPFLEQQAIELTKAAGEPPPEAAPARDAVAKPTAREQFLDATAALSACRFSTALPLLERVVVDQPGHGPAQFCLAYCKHQLGQYKSALERYDVARVLLPTDPRPNLERGSALTTSRNPERAELEYTKAIELAPDFARAYRDRGVARLRLGKLKEAEADFTAALERGSPALQIHLLRGTARAKLRDAEGAAADREAAAGVVPQTESDFLVRGYVRMAKEPKEALGDYREAEAINPRSLVALQNQAHVLADKLKDLPAALEAATKAAELYPEFAPSRVGRAVVLARLGKRAEAIEEAEKALVLSDDPEVTYQAACVYALTSKSHAEDGKQALDLLKRAFREGFSDVTMFRSDADLGELRSKAEFGTLERAVTNLFGR
jgi:serine/threonine protein kinase/Flp pilus assembly protein TadD